MNFLNKAYRIKLDLFTIFTFFFLCLRPSLVGFRFQKIVFIGLFLIFLLLLINSNWKAQISGKSFKAFILVVICNLYFLIQGLLLSDAKITAVNASTFAIMLSTILLLVLTKTRLIKLLNLFVIFHAFLCIFPILTFIISIPFQFDYQNIPVLLNINFLLSNNFVFETQFQNHLILFPFTPVWGLQGVMGVSLPRWIGWYTEPGLNVLYLSTAFVLSYYLNKKKYVRIMLGAGLILTFSAYGLLTLIILFIYRYIQIKKKVFRLTTILFMIVFMLVLILPLYSIIIEKLSTVSGLTRVYSFIISLERFIIKPIFGWGYYSFTESREQIEYGGFLVLDQPIGLIGTLFQIGLVGFILYGLCWYNAIKNSMPKILWGMYIPILLSILFIQPNYNDPFIWFLLMADFTFIKQYNNNDFITTTNWLPPWLIRKQKVKLDMSG